jgi:hypothetical protein
MEIPSVRQIHLSYNGYRNHPRQPIDRFPSRIQLSQVETLYLKVLCLFQIDDVFALFRGIKCLAIDIVYGGVSSWPLPPTRTTQTTGIHFPHLEMLQFRIRRTEPSIEIMNTMEQAMQFNRFLGSPVKRVQVYAQVELLQNPKFDLRKIFPRNIALELVEVITPDTRWSHPWEGL